MSAPSTESHGIPSDEPKTPMWLPAVGAVLFLTVGILWGLSPGSADAAGGRAPGEAAGAAGADAGRAAAAAAH